MDEAAEWFLRSEMPEGIHTYSIWLESKGEHEMALRFKNRARRMGFGEGEEEEEEDDEEEEEEEEDSTKVEDHIE